MNSSTLQIHPKPSVQRLPVILTLSIMMLTSMTMFSKSAEAQRVQPMVFELEPLGNRSSQLLRIDNTTQNPLTIEFTVSKITLDEYGNESREPAEDDFLIYPPQTLVRAGNTQMVKVKYVGDPTISASQAYRVSANQLPVNFSEEQSTGVGIVVNFDTLVNVAPKESKPILKISEITADKDKLWRITIENSGNRFVRLSTTSWQISDTSRQEQPSVTIDNVGKLVENNLLAPNSKMHLTIPAIEGFEPGSTTIDVLGS